MLKKRIAATLVIKDGIIVQSIKFKSFLPVGKPSIAVEFLNQWGIDEIILCDMSASSRKTGPDFRMIKDATQKCFVPLTVAGGITTNEQITELMHCGADKIALNQQAIHNPNFITRAAQIFGDQCIVVSMDVIKVGSEYKVFDYLGNQSLGVDPRDFAKKLQEFGAGEILLNSIDKDGTYGGYDLELINQVCDQVTIPVICQGGAKNARDFIEVFNKTGVSAAAAANLFHFTEHSVNTLKANIASEIGIRFENYVDYKDCKFDDDFRLLKKDDYSLEEMLYMKIEKEII